MLVKIRGMLRNPKGQGFVEYALALALIVVIIVVAFKLFGNKGSEVIGSAATALGNAGKV